MLPHACHHDTSAKLPYRAVCGNQPNPQLINSFRCIHTSELRAYYEPALSLLPTGSFQESTVHCCSSYQESSRPVDRPYQQKSYRKNSTFRRLGFLSRHSQSSTLNFYSGSVDASLPSYEKPLIQFSRALDGMDFQSCSTHKISVFRGRRYTQTKQHLSRRSKETATELDDSRVDFQLDVLRSIDQTSFQLDRGSSFEYNIASRSQGVKKS